ncbi:ATP-binding cassette domain-containing protein [Hydrogenophaga sp. ANAO-22]|uniref:ATP-binding cassette domain-containing protein n=1 Tax=Hydrogenophaga sp. ANAO-22 TaxID=3166645 RepID=UPI0036D3CC0F
MLNVSELTVDIQGSRILRGISLEVRAGELVCLLGRNGAGKTTTFRSLMGYLRPVSGRISWEDKDLARLSTWQIAQLGIGFSPEESEVYADLTVEENIELPTWTRTCGRPAAERISEAYRIFPKLERYRKRGGQSFRVASARWYLSPAHWLSTQNSFYSTNLLKVSHPPSFHL